MVLRTFLLLFETCLLNYKCNLQTSLERFLGRTEGK